VLQPPRIVAVTMRTAAREYLPQDFLVFMELPQIE